MSKKKEQKNPYVSLGTGIGGISVAVVAVMAVFVREQIWVAAPVVGALALMGVFLGYFQSKE